jgi:hypothetical protein
MSIEQASPSGMSDKYFCMFISDFQEGDSIHVLVNGSRVRGRVKTVNKTDNVIIWVDMYEESRTASLDDITYLAPFDKNWI